MRSDLQGIMINIEVNDFFERMFYLISPQHHTNDCSFLIYFALDRL